MIVESGNAARIAEESCTTVGWAEVDPEWPISTASGRLSITARRIFAGAIGLIGWWQGDTRFDDVLLHEIQTSVELPAGTYTSIAFDAGEEMEWHDLAWSGAEPAGTGLVVAAGAIMLAAQSAMANIDRTQFI